MKNTDMFSLKRAMDVLFVCVKVYLTTLYWAGSVLLRGYQYHAQSFTRD